MVAGWFKIVSWEGTKLEKIIQIWLMQSYKIINVSFELFSHELENFYLKTISGLCSIRDKNVK